MTHRAFAVLLGLHEEVGVPDFLSAGVVTLQLSTTAAGRPETPVAA